MPSRPYTTYDPVTGEIIQSGSAPNPLAQKWNGYEVIEAKADPSAQYVLVGELAPRPELPAVTASYDLSALPVGTTVTVTDESGTSHEITDMSGTLTLLGPQSYIVAVEPPFPFQPRLDEVEVI